MQQRVVARTFLVVLVLLNMLRAPAWAQQPASGLRIVIVEGDGAINNIRQRVNREPIVQVEDENRKPVAGAAVLFFLPEQGPSGTFANGSRMLMVVTDSKGQARASGIRPNDQSGPVQLRVTASFQGLTASAVISQTNVAGAAAAASTGGLSVTAKILIIVGIAAGATAGGIIATHNSGSGPAPPTSTPIGLSSGTPTVGGP
jgi:hypothetical protein